MDIIRVEGLSELFRSTEEQIEPLEAKITGQIPPWLNGSLVRLGPGKFDLGDFVMNHWFDGFAVLYKFDISKGKILFTKRFLQSDAYKKAIAGGRPVYTEFGTRSFPDPSKNMFSRMMNNLIPEMTDNDVINVFSLEDSVYVASETNYIRRIDVKSLETKEKVDFGKMAGVNLACSHMDRDSKGDYYTMGTTFISGLKYQVIKIKPTASGKGKDALEKSTILTSFPSSWKTCVAYYHSYGISENYLLFIEQPLLMNTLKLVATQVKGKTLYDCMTWSPEESNRFVVIEKSTGKVLPIKYKSKNAFFFLHHINTYEEDGQLVTDLVVYDSPEVLNKLFLEKLRNNEVSNQDPGYAMRFVLPLPTGKEDFPKGKNLVTLKTTATAEKLGDIVQLTPHVLTEKGIDNPSINESFCEKKNRYFYTSSMYDPGQYKSTLLKFDLETGDIKSWKESNYAYPGEMKFIPCPGSAAEDDGILLATVSHSRKDENDYLLILDAKTFTEIARAEVTAHVPNVAHGLFLPKS